MAAIIDSTVPVVNPNGPPAQATARSVGRIPARL
jgi:hypothetical protein